MNQNAKTPPLFTAVARSTAGLLIFLAFAALVVLGGRAALTSGVAASTPTPSLTPTLLPPAPTPTLTPTPTPTPSSTPTPTPTFTPTPEPCREMTGQVEHGTFFSSTANRDQAYRVYLPPCYAHPTQSETRYPVLYVFHGSHSDDAHWDDLGVTRVADEGINAGRLPPMIIVMPASDPFLYANTSGGDNSLEGLVVNELIPLIDRTYRTDTRPQARAIGGISRGGVWSLEIGFRHPELFCAVGGHSAALNVNLAGPAYDPIHLATDPRIKSLRIYLDAGDTDYTKPGSDDLHAALERAGVPHIYEIFQGAHADPFWAERLGVYLAFYAEGWR